MSSGQKSQKSKEQSEGIDFLAAAIYGLYCAFGIGTFVLAPLPMISAHLKFSDPWPKVVAIMGAVFAVSFMQVPLLGVVIAFIFGLVVSDAVSRKTPFWKTLIQGVGATTLVGLGFVLITSYSNDLTMWQYWRDLVDSFFVLLRESTTASGSGEMDFDLLKSIVLFEGPFLVVSALILSLWLSIGLAAHFSWFKGHHPLRASELRKLRLHWSFGLVFVCLFIRASTLEVVTPQTHVLSGVLRIVSTLLLIQGTILLSDVLNRKKFKKPARALIYFGSIVLGFYALIGLGIVAHFYFLKTKKEFEIGGSHESHSEAESRKIG